MQRSVHRNLVVATILVVLVIIYGSLFPFELRDGPGNPVLFLIGTWKQAPSSRGDLIANILLYMPYGFFGALAASSWSVSKRLIWVTLGGFVLCTAMEISQYYFVGRVTNMSDVYLNTFGSALGAVGGILLGSDFRWPLLREVTAKPFPALLLAAWYGYRLYPYVPTIDLHKYWHAIWPLFAMSTLTPLDLYRFTVIWLLLAYLIEVLFGVRQARFLFLAFAAVELVGKIFILDNALKLAEVLGILLAYALWGVLSRVPRRAGILATLMMILLVLLRLDPFQFGAYHPFGWIPFLGFMNGSIEIDIQSFLEKFFLYGSAIWILIEARLSLGWATALVAGSLFVTSLIETYLPGRSAELTDAALAVAIAVIYRLVPDRSAGPAPLRAIA